MLALPEMMIQAIGVDIVANSDLNINFSLNIERGATNPYWLRFEIVEDKSTMSVGEAADVIDALYNVSICDRDYPQKREIKPVPDDDDWTKAAAIIKAMPGCEGRKAAEKGDPGSYDVKVRVYRSHRYELYKIVLTNGSINNLKHIERRVELTLDLENQHSVTLDQPIIKYSSYGWQDIDGPDIHRKGNTLYWKGEVTGVLRVEFDTEFDLVDIHVNGINNTSSSVVTGTDHSWMGDGWYSGDEDGLELTDVQDTKCTLLGFYHYQYEELQLHKPENDESVDPGMADEICAGFGGTGSTSTDRKAACKAACAARHSAGSDALSSCIEQCEEDEKRCYRQAEVTEICICGGEENTVTKEVPVRCPEGFADGANVGDGGESIGYVDCGPDGIKDVDYLETCCEVPPDGITLPKCLEKHGPFVNDDTGPDIEDLKATYGDDAIIVAVGPAKGQCGETITIQDVDSKDCCDDIPAIEDNGSDPSIAEGGQVRFKGGEPLYHVVGTDGADFYIGTDQATKNPETGLWEASFGASSTPDPCAGNSITYTISDECSSVKIDMATENSYVPLSGPDEPPVVTPDSDVLLQIYGGASPYKWSDSQFLTFDVHETVGGQNTAHVEEDFCGTDTFMVTDSCGNFIDVLVRSSAGEWVTAPPCEVPYCCDNSYYGSGCVTADGTMDLGYGITSPTYSGISKNGIKITFAVSSCNFLNSGFGDEYCTPPPVACPGVGGGYSFECGENQGSRNHGTCGAMAAMEDYKVAMLQAEGDYDSVKVASPGCVVAKEELIDDYGNTYDRYDRYHLSMAVITSPQIWEC